MPRIARIVIPGVAHHIVQRGSRRLQTFFSEQDFKLYKQILKYWIDKEGIQIIAYCLMSNHIHLVAIPATSSSFHKGIGRAHLRYSKYINLQQGWTGHLWQERFYSCPLDDEHLFEAIRYVELNPVEAKVVTKPDDYVWSSARHRVSQQKDALITDYSRLKIEDWRGYWKEGIERNIANKIEVHARSGKPLGSDQFIRHLENITGRTLTCRISKTEMK
jgi:putative transposase